MCLMLLKSTLNFIWKMIRKETVKNEQEETVEVTVEEYPSYVKQQNGLTIYPDGAKEAYLKALEAAQIAKLNSFFSLEQRLSKPFVFSYFENVPRKRHSGTEVCAFLLHGNPRPLRLKGKRAEMKHIFGKIDTNDYYPGQKKNPIRKKKVRKPVEYESSYLTTDRSGSVDKFPRTERKTSNLLPLRKSDKTPNHSHINKVITMSVDGSIGE